MKHKQLKILKKCIQAQPKATLKRLQSMRQIKLKPLVYCMLLSGTGFFAETGMAQETQLQLRMSPSLGSASYQSGLGMLIFESEPRVVADPMYRENSRVARLDMKVTGVGAPADGVSRLKVVLQAYDKEGQVISDDVLLTVEHSAGRLDFMQASNLITSLPEKALDQDRRTPGTQIRLQKGRAEFTLLAPSYPQDVRLRVTAGAQSVEGVIPFDAELREMVAAGLIEGILRVNRSKYDSNVVAARLDDGFERQLRSWSRNFNHDQFNAAGRAAVFIKGKISGDALLSLSYDSDKDSREQLMQSVRPDAYYPVFGDSSVSGTEASSSGKLYVRVDQQRNFVLYGDFVTGNGFVQSMGSGIVAGNSLSQLGNYNRSMTGVRSHLEGAKGFANLYASRDSLRQMVQEMRANGTSGPFAVDSSQALENTDKLEILVRDKNDLRRVLMATPLQRWVDYSFEPFSGRILLARPLASLDQDANPQSLRVSYEVDQGGDPFWVFGADGQWSVSPNLSVGGSLVEDKNPLSPYRLRSINAGINLDGLGTLASSSDPTTKSHTGIIAEFAQSEGHPLLSNQFPAGASVVVNSILAEQYRKTAHAERLEIFHQEERLRMRAWASQIGADFDNPNAGLTPNTRQFGVNLVAKINDDLSLNLDARETRELTAEAKRSGLSLSLSYQLSETIQLTVGLRHSQEQGRLSGMDGAIGANPNPGSAFLPGASGGFSNNGLNGTQSNTGLLSLNGLGLGNSLAPGVVPDLNSNTGFVALKANLSEAWSVNGVVESASNQQQHRWLLGSRYQLSERTGVYANLEGQSGLASYYGLDPSQKSTSLSLGIDSSYMRGGNFFSEYRLRDASTGQEAQMASGVRNVWNLDSGVMLTTGAERLVIDGSSKQKATALTLGLDYTEPDNWKASARTEWRRLDAAVNGNGISNPANSNTPVIAGNPVTDMNNQAMPIKLQDSFLFSLGLAQKLNRDWTGLARNYFLATNNHAAAPNGLQNRLQIGAAYRPVDHNLFDLLGMFEFKTEKQINAENEKRRVILASTQANYHPHRPWWLNVKLAAKSVRENFPENQGAGSSSYKAFLLSGRVIYDISENWDLGILQSVMHSAQDGSTQYASGIEVGYLVKQNLWLSLGYNFTGFRDRDLSSDYTAQGAYMRLRYKFDQKLFSNKSQALPNTEE